MNYLGMLEQVEKFDLYIVIRNSMTGDTIAHSHHSNCFLVVDNITGYTGIKGKKGNVYVIYERLRYSDGVYFDDENKVLTVTFNA